MTLIIIAALGFVALLLIFSLFKKLIKLAFTAVVLLVLLAGIWYFWQQDPPEIPESVRQQGERAAETLKEAAGDALDAAAEVMEDGAEAAMERAGEALQEGTEKAKQKAGELVEDLAGEGESDNASQKDTEDSAKG